MATIKPDLRKKPEKNSKLKPKQKSPVKPVQTQPTLEPEDQELFQNYQDLLKRMYDINLTAAEQETLKKDTLCKETPVPRPKQSSAEDPAKITNLFEAVMSLLNQAVNIEKKSQSLKKMKNPIHVKARSGLINCMNFLYKRQSKSLFNLWSAIFPADTRSSVVESLSNQPSLIYMLFNDSNNDIRALAAQAISLIIDESPLDEFHGSIDLSGRVYNPRFHEIAGVLDNLHEVFNFLLRSQVCANVLIGALKASASLINQTPYSTFSNTYLIKLAESVFIHLGAVQPEVRQAVIKALIAIFKERTERLRSVITYDFMFHVIGAQDFIEERMNLFRNIIKNYPEEIEQYKGWVIEKLSGLMRGDNYSLQKLSYEITDEYIRVKPNCCMLNPAIAISLEILNKQPVETLIPALNSLTLIPDIKAMRQDQLEELMSFMKNFEFSSTSSSLLKSILLKLFGTLAKAQAIPEDFFDKGMSIITAHKDTSNMSVAINASLALSYFCLNPIGLSRIEAIIKNIRDNSENRREKVVSNAIVSISNLLTMYRYEQIQIYFEELFEICVKGLSHKTAKVGWDACRAFLTFFNNKSMPHFAVAERLIPNLIIAVKSQSNFKTKINSCQLLRKYNSELLGSSVEILDALISSLEIDGRSKHMDGKTLKYQYDFKQESVLCITHIFSINQELTQELAEFMSENALAIYTWLRIFVIDYIQMNGDKEAAELSKDEKIDMVRNTCRMVAFWVETEASVAVSYGLLEKFKALSRLSEKKIRKYMGYELENDSIIEFKNVLEDNY